MINPLPAGYRKYDYVDPFEDLVGPFGYRIDGDEVRFAFRVEARHCNTQSTVHGGMLMTFADFALCVTAVWDQPGEQCVTVSLNCEFVSAGQLGDLVESMGEVVRRTGALVFVRGQVAAGGRTLLNYSGVVKRLHAVPPERQD